MENDKFLRKTAGKLPEAEIAMIDECYKANEPTLNIMLSILNEKVFYNDGVATPIPLITLFAASNEMPDGDELGAFHDRMMFRIWVEYIKDPANKMKMFKNYSDKRNGINNNSAVTTITLDELKALQAKAACAPIGKDVHEALARLINVLAKNGITVSDRRQNECLKLMQGHATYIGNDYVSIDDMVILKHVLWEKKEDMALIESEIVKLANPMEEKIKDILNKYNEAVKKIDSITDVNQKSIAAIETKTALEGLIRKTDNIILECKKSGKDINKLVELKKSIMIYTRKLINEAVGFDTTTGAGGTEIPF